MAHDLFEAYKKRIDKASQIVTNNYAGAQMTLQKKLVLAKMLENIEDRFNHHAASLNEGIDGSAMTNLANIGQFKKFALNLTNVVMPTLIANELVYVYPMPDAVGYVTYIRYEYSANKGTTQVGDQIASPFKIGNVDVNFTGNLIVDVATGTSMVAAWAPVYTGDDARFAAHIVSITTAAGVDVPVASDASVTVATDGKTLTLSNGTGTAIGATDKVRVAYAYDNTVLPRETLPTIRAVADQTCVLKAHARTIAVQYSNFAQYRMNKEYNVNLADQLAEKAVAEMSREIDTEVIDTIYKTAKKNTTQAELQKTTFSLTPNIGVDPRTHYNFFTATATSVQQIIYKRTQKYRANYMLCAADVIVLLSQIDAFKPASPKFIAGPYFAGTLGDLKVFVVPNFDDGDYVIGLNGDDAESTVAVYAPYMPIIPTMLIQTADGTSSQGWSTMYDIAVLNPLLAVYGKVVA